MWNTEHLAEEKGLYANKKLFKSFSALSLLLFVVAFTSACGAPLQSSNSTSSTNPATSQLKIATQAGPATVGVPYNAATSVSGGSAPYVFTISSGSLPPGMSLNPSTGSITGTPSVAGTYRFVLSVTSSAQKPGGPTYLPVASRIFDQQSSPAASGSLPVQILVAGGSSVSIKISPSQAIVIPQGQQQFSAQVIGTASTAVSWSASVGTISNTGAFVAPKATTNTSAVITATSTVNPTLHATATVSVVPEVALAISSSAMPEANASTPYAATLTATGGVTPYQWSLSGGALPSGIQLQTSSGAITGTTSHVGAFPFTASVTDASGKTASLNLTLTVSSASASGYDGPAELPRVYIQTAMANTPAPGATSTISAGGDLQSALNSASCGDTIQLQAGATFTGTFTFPAKSCDDNHWIIVRTSSSDSSLPAEGARLTPCYAGISSLPARPSFHCVSTKNVLAKLVANSNNGPVVFASGANHYRLVGLEITRPVGSGVVTALASIGTSNATANNLILDRVWLHGTAQDETTRGIDLGGMSYASVVDSFFTDFHCISVTGACGDSQAILGGIGQVAGSTGPYKITDNFLEASGENILFGGGGGLDTPADIQISQNHFFKPLTWMKGQPGYVGGANGNPFIVKNLLELKNAQRVLAEANIMEYSWGGYSQVGFGIVFTPKNQSGGCPICQVTDITIRYSTISHVAGGFQIANAEDTPGVVALDGERYSIHDVTVDDINGTLYDGPGEFAELATCPDCPLLQSVAINHVTAFPPNTLFFVGDLVASAPMKSFTFTNSIVNAGTYPLWSAYGVAADCSYHDVPLTTFKACFTGSVFDTNAIIAANSNFPASKWPSGNSFPASAAAVQFVSYNNGNGGNYQLLSSSPYHNAGTDRKDLGADIGTIVSETTGVY